MADLYLHDGAGLGSAASIVMCSSGVQEVLIFPTNNNSIYTVCFSHGMGQWGKIKRIMRHRYDGDIVRLNQKWGECRVTANHSGLRRQWRPGEPDCQIQSFWLFVT